MVSLIYGWVTPNCSILCFKDFTALLYCRVPQAWTFLWMGGCVSAHRTLTSRFFDFSLSKDYLQQQERSWRIGSCVVLGERKRKRDLERKTKQKGKWKEWRVRISFGSRLPLGRKKKGRKEGKQRRNGGKREGGNKEGRKEGWESSDRSCDYSDWLTNENMDDVEWLHAASPKPIILRNLYSSLIIKYYPPLYAL